MYHKKNCFRYTYVLKMDKSKRFPPEHSAELLNFWTTYVVMRLMEHGRANNRRIILNTKQIK